MDYNTTLVLNNKPPRVVFTSDESSNDTNSLVTISYDSTEDGGCHVIGGVAWSYSDNPTDGNLTIFSGEDTIFSIDITNKGPGFIPFDPPLSSASNSNLLITLNGGGAGIVGNLNILGHWIG